MEGGVWRRGQKRAQLCGLSVLQVARGWAAEPVLGDVPWVGRAHIVHLPRAKVNAVVLVWKRRRGECVRPTLALPTPALRTRTQVTPGRVTEHHKAAKDSRAGFLESLFKGCV